MTTRRYRFNTTRLPTLDERLRHRRFSKRKRPVHYNLQRAAGHVREVTLDHGVHALMAQHQLGTQEDPRQCLVARAQHGASRNPAL